ncbi:MAG: dihydrolipoyl dehydrogenase [Candidatus Bipolaricaulota bacterium]
MKSDLIVVGGGPGGYVCALRAAQRGIKVALVEERHLGGVCLNWGCIPTKALYAATRLLDRASSASEMGITFAPARVDLARLAEWKEGVVRRLAGGIADLLNAAGVTVFEARGTLAGNGRVALSTGETLEATAIVLATGSAPVEIPPFPFSHPRVWSSDDALALPEVPRRLAVIGGGVVGLELATIYRRLGSEVTVIELLPDLLASVDLDRRIMALVKRGLVAAGIQVKTGVKATALEERNGAAALALSDGTALPVDRVLVAVGRRPRTSDLGLAEASVSLDPRGFVAVDERHMTTAAGIYAIGDMAPGPMLAHKASAEGLALADQLAGDAPRALRAEEIPQAVFTDPEVASVGLSERAARDAGHEVLVGRFPYAALGKALGMREGEGSFQVVADAADRRILGAAIVGAEASDLIAEAAVAVRCGLTLDDIAHTVHAHPSLPEGFLEAAEHALGRAIHTTNR